MMMTRTKFHNRIFAVLFAMILTITSLITLPATGLAASTSKQYIARGGSGRTAYSSTAEFTIKGSMFSKQKVSIYVLTPARYLYKSKAEQSKALDYIKKNAEFKVTVSYNGKVLETKTLKAGSGSFYLPKGNKSYTVKVVSTLKNYKGSDWICNTSAQYGQYQLKY